MGLDLRWPIGLMFTLIGAMLTITGIVTASDGAKYQRSLGINVDLWWGIVLLVFGIFMLVMAKRGASKAKSAEPEHHDESSAKTTDSHK